MGVKCRRGGGRLEGFLLYLHKSRLRNTLLEKCPLKAFLSNDTRYVPRAMAGARETHE